MTKPQNYCIESFCTHTPETNAYYFAPEHRKPGPYTKQIEVTAIVDVADDGTFAGLEIVDPRMPKP